MEFMFIFILEAISCASNPKLPWSSMRPLGHLLWTCLAN